MNKETMKQRSEKYFEWGQIFCSVCGGAIHNLPQGCMSKYCPTNKNDSSMDEQFAIAS